MKTSKVNIEEYLRKAIMTSSMSRYEIAKRAKVNEAQLSYFVNRKRSLILTSAAKVADFLGLELRPRAKKRKAGAKCGFLGRHTRTGRGIPKKPKNGTSNFETINRR
ncbi:MAG: hypothetical protein MUO27_07985 [Sedimentisphaerales bacterium]|nr:hypothetical protein [Sedimentisphaerales bacterium]